MKTWHLRVVVAILALASGAGAFAAPALDEYGGWPEVWGAKTGFFGLERIRDRWWFTTPEGNVFLSQGVDIVNSLPGEQPDEVGARLRKWGFNTVGPDCPDAVREGGIACTVLLNLSQPTIDAGAAPPGARFPDVFDPRFERIANEIAANVCSLHADSPWLLGYFTDDGLDWRDHGPGNLVDVFFAMPAESPGRQALVSELRRLHDDNVERFNAAWDLSLGSLDELSQMRELQPGPRFQGYAVSRDRARLLAFIAGRYFDVAGSAIRAHDPNHLVLGCRFAKPPGADVLAAMRGHVDVVSITGTPELDADVLTQMHNDSELPLLVTPLHVKGRERDTGAPGASSAEGLAAAYQRRIESLAKAAFVVGYGWPRYAETTTSPTDGLPGLVGARGEADAPLVSSVEKTNDRFYMQASLARLKPTLFEVVKRYELRRAGIGGVTVDGDLRDWQPAMAMELRPSAYEKIDSEIEAAAYLMWDAGALYFAGRLDDPSVEASTVTSYVGADWLELTAATYSYVVTLMPGRQTVTDLNRGKTRPATMVIGRVYAASEAADEDTRRPVAGYTFEGRVDVPIVIPEGFIFRFGLALHHYTEDGREVRLSFPYYWSPSNPASGAEIVVTGRVQQ